MRDLIILTADGTMNAVLSAFFGRQQWHMTLGCSEFDLWAQDDIVHVPGKTDGAVCKDAHNLLRPYLTTHQRAIVVLDQQFGGDRPAAEVQDEILENLRRNGWDDRCEVVVIDPELEVWLWQDKPQIAQAVKFKDGNLRAHLCAQKLWPEDQAKPPNPKEVIQDLIKRYRAGAPMAVYSKIARRVGVSGCTDASFKRFQKALQTWFPASAP